MVSNSYALPAKDVKLINNRDYFKNLDGLITSAGSSIFVIMFSAAYYYSYPDSFSNRLIRSLIEAQKRGVEVQVILEKDAHEQNNEKIREIKKILDKGGVKVYFDQDEVTTHCKLLIIDGKITIIGSTNWTYAALAKNNESAVIIQSEEVAEEYIKYFHQIRKKP